MRVAAPQISSGKPDLSQGIVLSLLPGLPDKEGWGDPFFFPRSRSCFGSAGVK